MKRIPKQKRALLKYDALLRAAYIEFSQNGYGLTTSKSIAVRANVATGTFYQYFDDKNDILLRLIKNRYEILKERYTQIDAEISADYKDQGRLRHGLTEILSLVLEFHAEMPDFHALIHHRRQVDQNVSDLINQYDREFQYRVLELVKFYTTKDAKSAAFVISSMAEGLVHNYAFDKPDIPQAKIISEGVGIIMTYLAKLSDIESKSK